MPVHRLGQLKLSDRNAGRARDWDWRGQPIPGTPYWVVLGDITQNEVLPNAVWEAVIDAVDTKCKVEDAERRTAAKDRPAKLTPRSKRRH